MRSNLNKLGRGALAVALFAGAAFVGSVAAPGNGTSVEAVGVCDGANGLGAGGEFHSLTPTRIYDTRNAELDTAPAGPKPGRPAGEAVEFDVPISGMAGLPEFTDADGDGADDVVLAVAVNVTVADPSALGFLQAYGKGTQPGKSSIVNFQADEAVPNSAILRPGDDGKLTMRVVQPDTGDANVIVDIFGWFSSCGTDERGARVVPVTPGRIYDSRADSDRGEPLYAGNQVEVDIRGVDTREPDATDVVPDSPDVVGALVNITGINAGDNAEPTFLSVVPNPLPEGAKPTTSNVNLFPDQVKSVMAMVPVGDDGKIRLYNNSGETDVAVDIVAYLQDGADPATRAGRVVPLVAPFRAIDTRTAEHHDRQLGPGQAETWSFEESAKSARIGDEPVGPQLGMLGNLTATNLQRQYPEQPESSYMAAYPSSVTEPPSISFVTISENQTMPNLALLRYGANPDIKNANDEQICLEPYCVTFFNRAGYVDYVYDISALILADE